MSKWVPDEIIRFNIIKVPLFLWILKANNKYIDKIMVDIGLTVLFGEDDYD